MTDIHIPPEALEAGARAILKVWHVHPWELADTFHKDESMLEARACCLAMLKAWPGMMMALTTDRGVRCLVDPSDATHIILPMTEKTDDR